ncbi:hypothetical protein ACN54_08215 [Escherichia coli]|nr:hypothetical protein ACN54_08215 [Escherichia coli]
MNCVTRPAGHDSVASCFLPLSYSRHHELRNPPCRTRQRRIRQSQVGDTARSVFYEYFRELL